MPSEIAHQDDVRAALIDEAREGRCGCRERHDRLATLALCNVRRAQPCAPQPCTDMSSPRSAPEDRHADQNPVQPEDEGQ